MSITNVSQNLLQADLRVKDAFVAGIRGYLSAYERVFIVEEPQRKDEQFTIVKTDNGVSEVADGGAYPLQSISELGANTISVRVYKSAAEISDLSDLFDNYGSINKSAMSIGFQFRQKADSLCADFLNNPTVTSAPYGFNVSGTTYPLLSTTQPIGDSGSVQSNRITGNMTKANANLGYVAMRNMKDHNGVIVGYQVRRVVHPTAETMNVWQLFQSPNEPESANRNDNWLNTFAVERIEWPLLTSTTGCYLLADKSDIGAKGLRLEVKELPTMRRILNPTTGNFQYQYRMVLFPGVTDYQGIVGIGF